MKEMLKYFIQTYECLGVLLSPSEFLFLKSAMKNFFLPYFFAFPLFLSAQQNFEDSLRNVINQSEGVAKSMQYQSAVTFMIRRDIDVVKKFLVEAEAFAATQKDPLNTGYFELAKGSYYSVLGMMDSATFFLEHAKGIGRENGSDDIIIKACSSLGRNFIASGKPEMGLANLFEALQLLDTHPDKELELKVKVNITWAYLELKRYEDCIRFGQSSMKDLEPQYEWIGVYMYNNMAVSFGVLGKLDSAKYFIEKGIHEAEKHSDSQSIANGYFILGTIYSNSGKYNLAIQQFLKARPHREKSGSPAYLVSDLYVTSDLYHKTGEFAKGVAAGLEGLQLAEQYNLQLKFEGVYEALAENYEGLGDFKNASKYYERWAIAKDSIYKNATAEAIAEMQTKYESEKKQQQIVLQHAQLTEQETEIRNTYTVIISLSIIIALVIVIMILARARHQRSQKLLKAENELLIREAFIQATIQSQESERKRFAQDLHDSMGQLISSLRMIILSVDNSAPLEKRVDLVSKSEGILDEMHKEIRSVAFNLMPQTLIHEGLLPALKEMARRINQSGSILMQAGGFDLPERLNELLEVSLYRIIQEWTNNVIKYAAATKIEIQLVVHENEITVTIEDDGQGFDANILLQGNGNGWKNIQSRLNLVKGSSDIDSVPGRRGTTMVLQVPMSPVTAAAYAEIKTNDL